MYKVCFLGFTLDYLFIHISVLELKWFSIHQHKKIHIYDGYLSYNRLIHCQLTGKQGEDVTPTYLKQKHKLNVYQSRSQSIKGSL